MYANGKDEYILGRSRFMCATMVENEADDDDVGGYDRLVS